MLGLELFDKDLARVGWVKAYESLTITARHNQQPTGQLIVASDHRRADALMAKGARYVCRYDGDVVSTGMLRTTGGDDVGPAQTLTLQLADDWRLLRRLLAWPVPTSAVTAQSGAEYAVYSGPAETVVKAMLAAAVTRMGADMRPPVTIAADQGRGGTITVQARMHYPVDRLFPLVDQHGIGITVRQVGAGLVVDCYEPTVFPQTLSYRAGTLIGGTWKREPPTATRVIVGGPGEGTARIWREYVDSAREAEWGDVVEVTVDARDIQADDANLEALMAARGAEALAEGAERSTLSVTLAETSRFRFGGANGLHVGDQVTAELRSGLTVTDLLREAVITNGRDGLVVKPAIGEQVSSGGLHQTVARLAKADRTSRTGN